MLRSFLGHYAYYCGFVKQFATIAELLHNLVRKGYKFNWSQVCKETFQQLKEL